MNVCVFCGEPIRPDEASVARPPMAAHAACADAALADDAHWDAIAEHDDPEAETGRRSAGCLGLLIATAAVLLAATSRRGTW